MMTPDDWLAWASADADRRTLPDLKPLLAALADAMRALRAADWNEDAAGDPCEGGEAAGGVDASGARP